MCTWPRLHGGNNAFAWWNGTVTWRLTWRPQAIMFINIPPNRDSAEWQAERGPVSDVITPQSRDAITPQSRDVITLQSRDVITLHDAHVTSTTSTRWTVNWALGPLPSIESNLISDKPERESSNSFVLLFTDSIFFMTMSQNKWYTCADKDLIWVSLCQWPSCHVTANSRHKEASSRSSSYTTWNMPLSVSSRNVWGKRYEVARAGLVH